MDELIGLLGGTGQIASALIPYNISEENIEFLRGRAPEYARQATGVGQTAAEAAAFTPFTVTTGTGATQVGAGGDITQTLGATPAQIQQGLLGQAQAGISGLQTLPSEYGAIQSEALGQVQNLLSGVGTTPTTADVSQAYAGLSAPQLRTAAGDVAQQYLQAGQQALGQATPTAQSVFEQIRGLQTPEEERQRLALENRLASQGRLGVQTSMFGGTPEQLALAKAQQEAQNQAALQAITTADQLATSQQQRAQQLTAQGLSADQIQAQLEAERLGQQLGLAGAGIQAQQAQEGLLSSALGRQTQGLGITQGLFGLGTQAGLTPAQQQAAQLANIQAGLGASYIPQTQELAALQAATNLANIRQSAGLGQAESLYRGGIAGLEAQAAADTSVAALEAARVRALADALGSFFGAGATTAASGATSPFEALATSLSDLFSGEENQ